MWWKLSCLVIVTTGLIFCLIPIRTHAVLIDPTKPPPPFKWTLSFVISNMYVVLSTLIVIGVLLVAATYIGFRIVCGS